MSDEEEEQEEEEEEDCPDHVVTDRVCNPRMKALEWKMTATMVLLALNIVLQVGLAVWKR